jgi:hypothetical protein
MAFTSTFERATIVAVSAHAATAVPLARRPASGATAAIAVW